MYNYINTNYYCNKLNDFLKKQFVWVLIVTALIYRVYMVNMHSVMTSSILSIPIPVIEKSFVIEPNKFLKLKQYYGLAIFTTIFFLVNNTYERFFKVPFLKERKIKWYDVKEPVYPYKKDELELIVGKKYNEEDTELSEKPKFVKILKDGLFQNILIIGTIGTGKTIATIAGFCLQFIYKYFDDANKKCAMLCLDVKGNFYKFVYAFAKEVGRWEDIITIEIMGKWKYNPLYKPNLSEIELANRCRYVLELFTGKNSDSYWLGKAEDYMVELFKLMRIYNDGYINFTELHELGTNFEYREEKIKDIRIKMKEKEIQLTEEQIYNFKTAVSYFRNEFDIQDDKIKGFILSSLTTMTQPFVSTQKMKNTFSPSKDEINFYGFEDVIKKGKIVVFKINANKEPKVAKLIAAYLKLDYQKEIMMSLDKGKDSVEAQRLKITVCDEYQEYCTKNDAEFLSQSREPRSITIASTQSYSSIKKALGNDETITNMLLQSFVNKIWLRTDDAEYTIPKILKQLGKVDKEKISKSVTENTQRSRTSFSIGRVLGSGKNLSSGYSVSTQKEHKFDEVFLSQKLQMGQAVVFLSDGELIEIPHVCHCTKMHVDGRIIYDQEKGEIRFTDNMEEVFKTINEVGAVDIKELDGRINGIKERDKITTLNLVKANTVKKDESNNKTEELESYQESNIVFIKDKAEEKEENIVFKVENNKNQDEFENEETLLEEIEIDHEETKKDEDDVVIYKKEKEILPEKDTDLGFFG